MIQCSPEAFRALSSREFHLKLRVTWRLTYGDGGIDITDRILSGEMGAISRSLAPFLAGYNASTIGLSIANDDGAFSPYLTTSHLAGGPNNYWGSEIVIEEGVELPDGTFEYLPVTVGRVQEAVFRPGRVEVQAMDILEILKRLPLGEEVRMVGVHPTSAFPIGLNPLLSDFIVDNSWVESGSVATSSRSWSHADKICDGAGWLLSGGFAKGAPLGWAAAEIARSALATLVALEDGTVSIVSEVMPYRWGDDRAAGDIFFPEVFGGDTAAGFQFLETLDTHCTEVIVNYQGAYAAYRATTDEYRVGRIVREVSMPLCARGSQAQWGARLVYEAFKDFPKVVSFSCYGLGLLVQLNDRIRAQDPLTDETHAYRVVSKVWSPAVVTFACIRNPHADEIFDVDYPDFGGSGAWGDALL